MFNQSWLLNLSQDYKLLYRDQSPIIRAEPNLTAQSSSAQDSSWLFFLASGFLVSVPVFIQAPLVRQLPWLSLFLTLGWLLLARKLLCFPSTSRWGDLLVGFSWSWLAGSIYWGWLRWEPLIHLPVEAIALPIAWWGIKQGWGEIGNRFYLGSLLGTAITDLYFYLTGLIPYWRQIMLQPDLAQPILQDAIAHLQTPWGIGWAIILLTILTGIGLWSLQKTQLSWWAFGGAILSTIVVDGIFWLAASVA